jgi:hypothetical protein
MLVVKDHALQANIQSQCSAVGGIMYSVTSNSCCPLKNTTVPNLCISQLWYGKTFLMDHSQISEDTKFGEFIFHLFWVDK